MTVFHSDVGSLPRMESFYIGPDGAVSGPCYRCGFESDNLHIIRPFPGIKRHFCDSCFKRRLYGRLC